VAQTFLSVSYRGNIPLVFDKRGDATKEVASAKYTDIPVCATMSFFFNEVTVNLKRDVHANGERLVCNP